MGVEQLQQQLQHIMSIKATRILWIRPAGKGTGAQHTSATLFDELNSLINFMSLTL